MENKKNNKKVLKISIFSVLAILFILLFLMIIYNMKQVDIVIMLESSVSVEEELQIESKIKEICKTSDIEHETKEDSINRLRNLLETDINIAEYFDGISSYKTKVKQIDFEKIKTELLNVKGIQNVGKDNSDIVDKNINKENTRVEYTGLTKQEIENKVIDKANSGKIYVPDVQKIINIKSAVLKETIENIELWEIYIEYEKSSLSAPMGQNYNGKSFYNSYYFAYNKENKKFFTYMFEEKEYSTLKGWSTKGHKNDNSYWVD